jgi:phage I-like protein
MSDTGMVIVPSNGEGFVELARTKQGRLFRKHILNKGMLKHPDVGELDINDAFVDTLKRNFTTGVCDIVQVPLANDRNQHSESPEANIGEVIGLEEKDNKVYAIIDAREAKHADRLGKTYLGASAMLHMNYTDTRTGEKVGPTLLHTCVTNRPYVTGLEDYQEILAATSDTSGDAAVLLAADVLDVETPPTEETTEMTDAQKTDETPVPPSLEDLLGALKTHHSIDVPSLQAQAAEAVKTAALSQTLAAALKDAGVVKLANTEPDTVSTEDVVGAVAELANSNVTLTDRVNKLERKDAEHIVDALIGEGRVMPKQRPGFVELRLTNQTMFDQLVPAEPIVKLSNENGVTPPQDDAHTKDVDKEVARLAALLATTKK